MTDLPPAGDRPEPEDVPPTPPEAAPPAPSEPSVPQWTSAEAAPAPPSESAAPVPAAPAAAAAPPPQEVPPAAVAAAVAPAVVEPSAAQPPAPAAWQAPPTAPPKTPEVPGAPGRYFAATVTRVAALLIDGLLLAILAGIVGAIVSAVMPGTFGAGSFQNGFDTQQTAGFVVIGLGGLIVSYLYFYLSWRSAGKATPGQRIFKMQVGNAFDGTALDARQITIRWLTLFGLGILAVLPILAGIGGLLSFIWDIVLLVTTASSATKQGIHDRWANSAVVATGPQNTGLAWGCLIVYVVGIVLFLALALAAIIAIVAAVYSLQ